MHSRTESGIPLDWQHVRELQRRELAEAAKRRAAELVQKLGRQPTPIELETALAEQGTA